MTFQVITPLVITKKPDGSDLYLYQDAIVPDSVGGPELTRLAGEGFIKELSAAEAKVPPAPPISESN